MVQLRAPTRPPSPPQYRQVQILFRHPGYDDDNNVLFKLQASDIDDHGQPGLFAQFAIDACAIIAGDYACGRGRLSLSRDGSVSIDPTSTLRERSYYFHLDAADDDPYPIVPNFRQWKYPHDRLPPHWQQLSPDTNPTSSSVTLAPSNLTTALLLRDGSCRLSGCREQLQVAHVVPQSELDWWKENDMSRYNTGSTATLDDTANALLLRADLHIAFDKPRVALVPKPAADDSMRLVAHLLEYSPEIGHLYHNRELHPTAVGVDMLYARFAWSVFTLLDAFLECKIDRRLTLRASDVRLADARGFVTPANCELFSSTAARRRSQSPKKRKPNHDTVLEAQQSAEPPTSTNLKRKSIAEAEGLPSKVIAVKRARQVRPPSASVSDNASALTPTHLPTDTSVLTLDSESLPVQSLAQTWLELERRRSDPHGIWNKEQNWAQCVWDGGTLTSDDAAQWLEAVGMEIRDV
ncbi:hypothetical protein CC86DRAFT_374153 [Ophiobolus disseminans]|uniref:HNH nuclease domain-containing protein n=1 Tax=Ophiobolus disseminans TaxID=1469910 RepID=A0A6A6ZIF9_9PLEO|nr:hypothetical protein CC86DRAFT_374153 [Ophiobolus disseminans]